MSVHQAPRPAGKRSGLWIALWTLAVLVAAACAWRGMLALWEMRARRGDAMAHAPPRARGSRAGAESPQELRLAESRRQMVDEQLRARDISDARVLAAMRRVERHRFVPDDLGEFAYSDQPLPIGHRQTISQPYIVALMTQEARPRPRARALDIGTGSGYQAAVLAELCREVFTIEIIEPLAASARRRLAELGYRNVEVRCGDGYRGWPEKAPFDVIIVAAAPDHIPQPLVDQLAPGGRLVIPVGRHYQDLLVVERQPDGTVRRWSVAPVAFVPMTGEAEQAAPAP